MKAVIFTAVIVVLAAVVCADEPERYSKKFDDVDVDSVISNDRLLNNYIKCMLGQGKCTKDGAELKTLAPEALKTDCAKCTEKQKENSRKLLKHLFKNKQDKYAELEAVFDPDKEFRKRHEAEFQA